MAFNDGGYDSAEYSALSSNNFCGEEEESLLASYRDVTLEYFTGAKAFRRSCVNRERNFTDGSLTSNEYIVFTRVGLEDMETVDKVRGSLPKMCCQYDAREEILIVKLMVGIGHESSSIDLLLIFADKLRDLGLRDDIRCTGSTRFGDTRRHKEADQSFKPRRTRPAPDAWPSLTCEVGFSESLNQLRNDARFWITQSQLQTRLVLVIHIDKVRKEIKIERWELINAQRAHRGNVQYPATVSCIQRIELTKGGVSTQGHHWNWH